MRYLVIGLLCLGLFILVLGSKCDKLSTEVNYECYNGMNCLQPYEEFQYTWRNAYEIDIFGFTIIFGKQTYTEEKGTITNLRNWDNFYWEQESLFSEKNCSINYHRDGWLGVWREGEEIPGLVFLNCEIGLDRDGNID